jgi:hypothetical protein
MPSVNNEPQAPTVMFVSYAYKERGAEGKLLYWYAGITVEGRGDRDKTIRGICNYLSMRRGGSSMQDWIFISELYTLVDVRTVEYILSDSVNI